MEGNLPDGNFIFVVDYSQSREVRFFFDPMDLLFRAAVRCGRKRGTGGTIVAGMTAAETKSFLDTAFAFVRGEFGNADYVYIHGVRVFGGSGSGERVEVGVVKEWKWEEDVQLLRAISSARSHCFWKWVAFWYQSATVVGGVSMERMRRMREGGIPAEK